MHYAIVINLDYASYSEESCHALWKEIRNGMVAADFRCDGRTFTINKDAEEACQLARDVIEKIEQQTDKSTFLYIKEFYGLDLAYTTNLLLPADDGIILEDDEDDIGPGDDL